MVDPDLPDPPTVGDIPTDSLEEMLDALSDGSFETGALKNYAGDISDLEAACRQSIRKFRLVPLSDRSVLARIISDVMANFEQADLRWHPWFLKAVLELRKGGELKMPRHFPQQRRRINHGDVLKMPAVLSCWYRDLEPERDLLQRIADIESLPQSYIEGIDFLSKVEYAQELDNEPLPACVLHIQEIMHVRADESLPTPQSLRRRR